MNVENTFIEVKNLWCKKVLSLLQKIKILLYKMEVGIYKLKFSKSIHYFSTVFNSL